MLIYGKAEFVCALIGDELEPYKVDDRAIERVGFSIDGLSNFI